MIDDKIEEGLSEEEAVASIGSPEQLALQISEEIRAQKNSKKRKRKRLKAWEICVLILGSPLWIAFLAVGLAIAITVFSVILTVNVALWAIELPFFIFSLLSRCFLIACKYVSKFSISFTKKFTGWVADFFSGRDENK